MNTIVVYASMGGTTEQMALTIADELTKAGDHVVVKDAIDTLANELESYERILIGSYTWGDGDLSDEITGFCEELSNMDLTRKMAASFGLGDSTYDRFARAVDILEEVLKNQGYDIMTEGLKVDSYLEDEAEVAAKCISFVHHLIHSTQQMTKEKVGIS